MQTDLKHQCAVLSEELFHRTYASRKAARRESRGRVIRSTDQGTINNLGFHRRRDRPVWGDTVRSLTSAFGRELPLLARSGLLRQCLDMHHTHQSLRRSRDAFTCAVSPLNSHAPYLYSQDPLRSRYCQTGMFAFTA